MILVSLIAVQFLLATDPVPPVGGSAPPAQPPSSGAPAETTQPPVEAKKTARADDKIVCRRQETTGSRIPRRVCYPQWEWDAISNEARSAIRDTQRGMPFPCTNTLKVGC